MLALPRICNVCRSRSGVDPFGAEPLCWRHARRIVPRIVASMRANDELPVPCSAPNAPRAGLIAPVYRAPTFHTYEERRAPCVCGRGSVEWHAVIGDADAAPPADARCIHCRARQTRIAYKRLAERHAKVARRRARVVTGPTPLDPRWRAPWSVAPKPPEPEPVREALFSRTRLVAPGRPPRWPVAVRRYPRGGRAR